jgi:hypothetical protein
MVKSQLKGNCSLLKEGITLDDVTKSKLSKRNITLTDDAIKALKIHQGIQDQNIEWLTPDGYQQHNLVFARDDGFKINGAGERI